MNALPPVFIQCGSYPCFVSIVNCFFFFLLFSWEKNGGVHVFCFFLSNGNRSSTCLFNLADTSQASSTHNYTSMTDPFYMIQPKYIQNTKLLKYVCLAGSKCGFPSKAFDHQLFVFLLYGPCSSYTAVQYMRSLSSYHINKFPST